MLANFCSSVRSNAFRTVEIDNPTQTHFVSCVLWMPLRARLANLWANEQNAKARFLSELRNVLLSIYNSPDKLTRLYTKCYLKQENFLANAAASA